MKSELKELTTNEGRELIALFDGWERHPNWPGYVHNAPKHLNENGNCSVDNLRYDESWDWLMPVMKKAEKAIKDAGWGTPTEKEAWLRLKAALNEVYNINIQNANYCLVKFIQWYNELKRERG